MSLRELVYGHTVGDPGVAAIIVARCYPDRLPDSATLPCVSFIARVSAVDTDTRHHEGAPDRVVSRVQLNAYAETGDGAEALAAALIAAWSGYQSLPSIGYVQVANVIDDWDAGLERYRTIIDLMIEGGV